MSRTLVRAVILSSVLLAGTSAALAQTPRSTPRPTPPPGDPRRPPGQDPIPGTTTPTTPTQNPQAPPAAPQTNPAAPPGTIPSQQQPVPGATPGTIPPQTPVPGATPGTTPQTGEPLGPVRDPVIPQFQPRPLPPVPSLQRLGVGSETLPLSLNDAIKRALENNNDIEVARDDVRIAETQLRALEGVFDPIFSITPQYDKRISPQQSSLGGSGQTGTTSTTTYTWSPSITKQFGRGGGNYFLQFANTHTNTSNSFSLLNPFYSSNLSLSFTQPLLRDRSIDNNRRQIRIQRKRLDQSDADFRQRTIEIITRVQQAYWELVFALRDQQNQLSNLNLSRESLRNIEAQIAAGARAPLERAEVLTELANRETALLTAIQQVAIAENNLKVLIFKEPTSPDWSAQLTPTEAPKFDTTPVNLPEALKAARDNRPELRRLRLQNDINDIDIQFFKNQTKPRIDLVGTVATTGLAGNDVSGALPPGTQVPLIFGNPATNSTAFLLDQIRAIQLAQGLPLAESPLVNSEGGPNPVLVGGYGQTLRNLFSGDTRNITVGVTIEFPFRNRQAKANLAGARIQKEQLMASTRSQEQIIEVDVRNSAQAVESARQRVLSAREARTNAEMQLEGEQRLYQVGRSTTFLLFQRENALANARASELRAETDYNKALADLQRATSTTLRANNVVVENPVGP
ncbi:MAG TPA: TolC family protein [Pyrinomonadaceae bacterium]|nr:TolC family protein [Pyrinomonadaceae bacterium]